MKPYYVMIDYKLTDSMRNGFLPAACRLGYDVAILTNCVAEHNEYVQTLDDKPLVLECDVYNPIAIIETIHVNAIRPMAIFSNSDHLQAATSMAAEYYRLPAKDWQVAIKAKNKSLMRQVLGSCGSVSVWNRVVCERNDIEGLGTIPFPCIVKPCKGVASLHVGYVQNQAELISHCERVWRESHEPLIIEARVEGQFYSVETLGDGRECNILGGFKVNLMPPPYFYELESEWVSGEALPEFQQVVAQLSQFGICFGACHTEFMLTDKGPVIIEINYRSIGDGNDFLLDKLVSFHYFEKILEIYAGASIADINPGRQFAFIKYVAAEKSLRIHKCPALQSFQDEAVDISFRPIVKVGDTIKKTFSNKDYLGVILGRGECRQRLLRHMAQIEDNLEWDFEYV